MATTFTPKCEEYVRNSRGRCGEEAVGAVERYTYGDGVKVEPICKRHIGFNKRRKYGKREVGDITPELLVEWEAKAKAEAEAEEKRRAVKRAESERRHQEVVAQAIIEDAREWMVVYAPEEALDWTKIEERGTITVPKWEVLPVDGGRSWNNPSVKIETHEDRPPTLEVSNSSRMTPKQAAAFSDALLRAVEGTR